MIWIESEFVRRLVVRQALDNTAVDDEEDIVLAWRDEVLRQQDDEP